MSTRDGRRRSEAAKAATRRARLERASRRRRAQAWTHAATVAAASGQPVNTALHVTWSALEAGDRREGHILGLGVVERERRLWAGLSLVAKRAGVPWLALRGPEHSRQRGLHLHLAFHLPVADVTALRDAIGTVERLTGSPAEWIDTAGRTERGAGGRCRGVVARSACGGWLLQRTVATIGDGSGIAAYAAKGDGKAQVAGQHRLSNALSALARQAVA